MAYRWLVSLYPYEFRQTYRDELEADFEDARREAKASGSVALARLWLRVIADLMVSLPREWLRTPWLAVLTVAAIAAALVFYYVVGRVYRAGSFAATAQPPESPQLVLLMGLMVLVPTAAVIVISAASQFFRVRPPRRRRV
jgi:hypothetical protein